MSYTRVRPVSGAAITCVLVSLLTSTSQAQSTTLPAPKFLYSTNNATGKVRGYLVNATTGSIKATGQIAKAAHTGPTRVVSDKGGYRLYVINQGSKDLNAY